LIYQVMIALILAASALNLALNMRALRVPRRDVRLPAPAPKVSVIVPARNEEANIGRCLGSLLKQDYPDFEIIVLNDNSEDRTAAVVRSFADSDPRVRLLDGEPLPPGWAGKPHACFQAAQKATGEWLLFTDADTIHSPDMLRRSVGLAASEHIALLSGFPHQLATSISQKIVIPMMYFVMLTWAPLWALQRSKKPVASIAIGQFLLFPRDVYWAMGGHEAVKNRIMEDLWMGVEVSKRGGRHLSVDLSDMVSCRMYGDLGSIWEGLTRALQGITAMASWGLVALLAAGYCCFLAPFFWTLKLVFDSAIVPAWAPLVLLQVSLIFIMRRSVDARFKESAISTALFPFGIAVLIAVVINGMARQLAGAGVSWKKRIYEKGSSVE
jgi:chlorobactene glucosyltransferase